MHTGTPKILVTGAPLDRAAAEHLAAAGYEAVYAHRQTDAKTLTDLARDNQVCGIIVRQGFIDAALMDASPRLRAISRHGSGVDTIDLDAAAARGIPVLRASGGNARSVAEHTLAFMFALVKNLPRLDRSVREGEWIKIGYSGQDLIGMRVGIVGYGHVGKLVSELCRMLSMDVAIYDPKVSPESMPSQRISVMATPHDLAARSDILSLHCPLNDSSRHMIDDALLERMPMGSWLINAARGGIVDEPALLRALDTGRLAGAGLDTFESEPLPPDSPLRYRDTIMLSPHVAGAGRTGMRNMALLSVVNLLAALDDKPLPPSQPGGQ